MCPRRYLLPAFPQGQLLALLVLQCVCLDNKHSVPRLHDFLHGQNTLSPVADICGWSHCVCSKMVSILGVLWPAQFTVFLKALKRHGIDPLQVWCHHLQNTKLYEQKQQTAAMLVSLETVASMAISTNKKYTNNGSSKCWIGWNAIAL